MYDELVKALRGCVLSKPCDGCPYYDPNGPTEKCATMNIAAADAIEELSRENKSLAKSVNEASEILRKRWIPVTERLPEQKINQNTLDFEYVLCSTTFGDVRPYKFGRRIGQGEPHFWNGAGYVDAYVTHWMPLPDAPEEGET